MNSETKRIIEAKDYDGLRRLLKNNGHFANEGITIPFDTQCKTPAHPLHRICDAVCSGHLTDDEALQIAKIFVEFGADVNGASVKMNEDTPLLAAASLYAEEVGIFYIENGADIHYKGRQDGATALHWAAYCGQDKLVRKLIEAKAIIDQRDTAYHSGPLGWAVHFLETNEVSDPSRYHECIRLLLNAGADISALHEQSQRFLKEKGLAPD